MNINNFLSIIAAILIALGSCEICYAISSEAEESRQRMLKEDARQKNEKNLNKKYHEETISKQFKQAGFIAVSPVYLLYNDAVTFCKKNGGRLPKVNNSKVWDFKNPPERGVLIDGFGYGHRPFSELGLPEQIKDAYVNGAPISFWTDTSYPNKHYGPYPIFVFFQGYPSRVELYTDEMQKSGIAACVPY